MTFELHTFIAAEPAQVWMALTDRAQIGRYYIGGAAPAGEMRRGGRLTYRRPDGTDLVGTEVREVKPRERLALSFEPLWMGAEATKTEMAYELTDLGGATKLTIRHDGLPPEHEGGIKEGWMRIASALKTLLETGRPFAIPREEAA